MTFSRSIARATRASSRVTDVNRVGAAASAGAHAPPRYKLASRPQLRATTASGLKDATRVLRAVSFSKISSDQVG